MQHGQYVRQEIEKLAKETKAIVHNFKDYYVNAETWWDVGFMGTRLKGCELTNRCEEIMVQNKYAESADLGCALCAFGYNSTATMRNQIGWKEQVDEYLKLESTNPHIIRWQISLAYLYGKLYNSIVHYKAAIYAYNFKTFSPLILTKILAAARECAAIYVKSKHFKEAQSLLYDALARYYDGMSMPLIESIGTEKCPSMNGIIEMWQVQEQAARTLFMMNNIEYVGTFEYEQKTKEMGWSLNTPCNLAKTK